MIAVIVEIIVAIWLTYLGYWFIVVGGILFAWLSVFPMSVLMLLYAGMAFVLLGFVKLIQKLKLPACVGYPVVILATLSYPAMLIAWGLAALWAVEALANPRTHTLVLIWSIVVAVWPWVDIFQKAYRNPEDREQVAKTAYSTIGFVVGYLVSVLSVWLFGASVFACLCILIAFQILPVCLSLSPALYEFRSKWPPMN